MFEDIRKAAFEDELEKISVNWLNLGKAALKGATDAVAREGTRNIARSPAVTNFVSKATQAISPNLGKQFTNKTINKLLTSHGARKKLINQGAGAIQNVAAEVGKQRNILGAHGQLFLQRGTKALTNISKSIQQQGSGFANTVRSI